MLVRKTRRLGHPWRPRDVRRVSWSVCAGIWSDSMFGRELNVGGSGRWFSFGDAPGGRLVPNLAVHLHPSGLAPCAKCFSVHSSAYSWIPGALVHAQAQHRALLRRDATAPPPGHDCNPSPWHGESETKPLGFPLFHPNFSPNFLPTTSPPTTSPSNQPCLHQNHHPHPPSK